MDNTQFIQRGGKRRSKKSSKKASKRSSKRGSKRISKRSSKRCSKGKIMRNSYISRSGKKVPAGCITAQSNSGKKTSLKLARYLASKDAMHKLAREKFPKQASKKCSRGQIMREGYKRKSFKSHSKTGKKISVKGSWTAPGCIKSVTGKSKKGSKLITIMDKDVLGKYGYDNIKTMGQTQRHAALRKAIHANKPLSIYRRIIAIATLNKNRDKSLYKILRKDAAWIKTQTEYIIKSSKKSSKKSKKSSKNSSKKKSKKSSKKKSKKSSKKSKKSSKKSKKSSKRKTSKK